MNKNYLYPTLQIKSATSDTFKLEFSGLGETAIRFFKIKLIRTDGKAEYWAAIRAKSIGEAVVIADTRSMDSSFGICDNSFIEITRQEYFAMLGQVC
ncbi:hypothetical protein [Pontibacter rugosus]|uniref:Uncharacterized protein n=1 Tax=Pontibacter rugosus TaxID=1745966 RepID=A0ABW3SR11_9BACT